LWWVPEQSIVAPRLAGQVAVLATGDAVFALDAFHGREVWRAPTAAAASGPAISVDATVVVWTADGVLHGLELGRGVTRWETGVGAPGKGGLTVAAGLVIVATNEHVTAVDPSTGRLRWTGQLTAPPTEPVVAVGDVAVVGTERGVDAFDAKRGKVRWRAPSRTPVDLPLCPASGSVWVSAGGGQIHRVDIANGRGLGMWDVGSPVAGMTADGDMLYASVVGPAQLVAVDPSGWVRWATALTVTSPEPALIAGTAYVAEPSGHIRAIDTVEGEVVKVVTVPFEPFGAPVGFVDRLILQERSGRAWCVQAPNA
jgi:outer membrane protein assembly factor BamB